MAAPHIEYIHSLNRYDIKPGLERMEALMEALGHPERKFKSIHISGTNGKGSVAAMLESVLREAGLKTGLYTSPDIYSFNERIRTNGVEISSTELADSIWRIKEVAETHDIKPSFFEFTTAVAYEYFAKANLDIVVVEVGMGGKWDATNVITPVLSIITNVGLDHQEFLGDTKEEIAAEKAGIIKEGVSVVTGETHDSVRNVITEYAEKQHVPVIQAEDVIQAEVVDASLVGQRLNVSGEFSGELMLPLLGQHQVDNTRVALAALVSLRDLRIFTANWETIVEGIKATRWEGRMDIVQHDPLIIVDGAHNADGVAALEKYVKALKNPGILILGVKKGRDMEPFVSLAGMFQEVVITKGNFMPEDPGVVLKQLNHTNAHIEESPADAITYAKSNARGPIVIAGSLYLVADALAVLRQSKSTSR